MWSKSPKRVLVFIIFVAALLRFVNLSSNPPALYWDEASIGYNAFSILKTGADEHGVKFPITHFLAYGDAKPPLYIYATSLSMAVFGVSDFSVRFPSALAGTLAIPLVYFLVQQLFTNYKRRDQLALTSALLLTISPWHLQMSRAGFEANLALTLFLAGLLAFLFSRRQSYLISLSAIFFAATLFTFNAYRIFLPLFAILVAVSYRHHLLKHARLSLVSAALGLALVAPLVPFLLTSQAKLRFDEVTIFKNQAPIIEANLRNQLNHDAIWSKIIHNRRLLFLQEFLIHYSDHFKPDFLFISGDVNPRLSTRDQGELYLIELPLLLLGLYYLFKSKQPARFFLIGWLLLAFIPAGVARETPHALRSLQALPVPQIIVALGIVFVINKYKHASLLLVTGYLLLIASYLNTYHLHYPKQYASSWQYGYKQLVNYVVGIQDQYDKVFITGSLGRPHTYFLFYQQYDPVKYLETRDAGGDAYGFTFTNGFDKYRFGDADPFDTRGQQKWLLISRPDGVPHESHQLHTIYDPLGNPVFIISDLR